MSIFRKKAFSVFVVLIVLTSLVLAACDDDEGDGDDYDLRIVAGSENKTLEGIIDRWARDKEVSVQVEYLGSLDIMLDLQDGETEYDVVWPANSIWLDLGDQQGVVKQVESIWRSPVVLGVKRSIAERLGWAVNDPTTGWTAQPVTMQQILTAAEDGEFTLMMTSSTQSNSGASAYFAFLQAFAGTGQTLTAADLENDQLRTDIQRFLRSVDRSSGSSGWLMDYCVEQDTYCQAMINYETMIIEANQTLTEPLFAIYPTDGVAIADSPMGYVDKDDDDTRELFEDLQQYLLSAPIQTEIEGFGRRTQPGMRVANPQAGDFNSEWGIDVEASFSSITFPTASVIRQALVLYQTDFRKGSFTIYCLDYSGSMDEPIEGLDDVTGADQLKDAMDVLLRQNLAAEYFLQASPNDITVVLLFTGDIRNYPTVSGAGTRQPVFMSWAMADANSEWTVVTPVGDTPQARAQAQANALNSLAIRIRNTDPGGDTNIFLPVYAALQIFNEFETNGFGEIGPVDMDEYFPAIILMTDGDTNEEAPFQYEQLASAYPSESGIPVYGILFGNAEEGDMNRVAQLTDGRVFDGTEDLVGAFRSAKGYNN
ncbi:MAG: solute-binding protein [Chloroflexi bacterium]|nr:solute-binding protein [Chloroflexota bacterium]